MTNLTADRIKADTPEKRKSWNIDGSFLDFKEPVTLEEAAEFLTNLRKMWSFKHG